MRTKDKHASRVELDKLKEEVKQFKENVRTIFKAIKEELKNRPEKKIIVEKPKKKLKKVVKKAKAA